MARGRPFIRHSARRRPQIVRLNIIYGNVQVFDNSSNTSNLNSHNVENIYSDLNSDWEDINESSFAEDSGTSESKPEGAPHSPDMFTSDERPHGDLEGAQATDPATARWPFITPGISDRNRERVDQTRHENAHVLPPWVDSEDANDTNPPKGLQRAAVKRASRGFATRLRSVWRRFF